MAEQRESIDAPETRSSIDHELELVDSAVEFVMAGAASRVVVAGLNFGRQIMARPSDPRTVGRVRLEALWRFDHSGCDIAVLADG